MCSDLRYKTVDKDKIRKEAPLTEILITMRTIFLAQKYIGIYIFNPSTLCVG